MFSLERRENFRASPLTVTAQLLVTMMHAPKVDASVDVQLPQRRSARHSATHGIS
jgi:hypothetical protein